MDTDAHLTQLGRVLKAVDGAEAHLLLRSVTEASSVHVGGVGRSGLVARAFAMRLVELGRRAHVLGEATAPACQADDLLLVCSGSGRTASMLVAAERALAHGARLALVTAAVISPLARLAHQKVILPPFFLPPSISSATGQLPDPAGLFLPMRTLFEQATFLFLDSLALQLMEFLGQRPEDVEARRPNLD